MNIFTVTITLLFATQLIKARPTNLQSGNRYISPKSYISLTKKNSLYDISAIKKLPAHRIINGLVAEQGQFPWQIQMIIDQSIFCGGSLISNSWILTAAHCAKGGDSFVVTLGGTYINSRQLGSLTLLARKSVVHEDFDPTELHNDIALIDLQYMLTFTDDIRAVILPKIGNDMLAGESVLVSGWGKTSDVSSLSSELMYVKQRVITNEECEKIYGDVVDSGKICVTGSELQSTCSGDSGGPLVLRNADGQYIQVGIVSFGAQDGCALDYPTAYTRVSAYLQWISKYTQ